MDPHVILIDMEREYENAILALKGVKFRGEKGVIGPLNMMIRHREDKVVLIENAKDRFKFARIIKGLEPPDAGRIIKRGHDTTGWIVPDGLVCAVEKERFFSRTVQGEIAFAADVARAKNREKADVMLSLVLEKFGIGDWMASPIDRLTGFEQTILSLSCVLLMLPEAVVFLNPLEGYDTTQGKRYTFLFELGRKTIGCACLQVVSRKEWALPLNEDDAPENVA